MGITIESSKKWKTAIADSTDKGTVIRGVPLQELISQYTFTEAIFLVLKGEKPGENERRMLDAMLVSSVDHGIATPSAQAARIIRSGGSSLNAAVAGGLLSLGDHHGGAIEGCAGVLHQGVEEKLKAKKIVAEALKAGKRLPGFGHKIYTTDPRTQELLTIAQELDFVGKYVKLAQEIEQELEAQKGRKLCMNVDAALAALLLELGFDWQLAKGFFIISRTVGLVAHAHEEKMREKPFRRLSEDEYEYDGKEE